MRALVCQRPGEVGDLRVEERDDPVPGAGQVVVDVRAAGLNYVDVLLCRGLYQIKPPTPFVPGTEVAGEVCAVGSDVVAASVGDKVMVSTGLGGFAERVTASEYSLVPMPDGMSFAVGATLVQSYATAMFALTRRTSVRPGEWVLVLGAGGGVGLAAVDVATALGARVIGAASSEQKLAAAEAAGAVGTVQYESEDLKARVRELTGGGTDVVVDPVGGSNSELALRATRNFARFCAIGFASGSIPSVPLNRVLLDNRTLVGVDWGAWSTRDPEGNRAMLRELMGWVGDGRLHPPEPAGRPLGEAASAMSDLMDRRTVGKVALVP